VNINLTDMAYVLNQNAREKGFWDENNGVNFYIKQMAMIHSEVSETLEALRKQHGDEAVLTEMADTIIRILDLYGGMRVDGYFEGMLLEDVLLAKVEKNKERPRMHGVLA
jgi:NTP pyrophosphatase (non-canonical NTP hydrolase)